MDNILTKLKNSVIVSCQASQGEPIQEGNCLQYIIKDVIKGGAKGLRLAEADNIRAIRKFSDIPIIGITKIDPLPLNWKEIVYITPTFKEASQIAEAGADIIALDGTLRKRPEQDLPCLISKIKNDLNKLVMADISSFEEGLACSFLGADIISTTLSGYTSHTLDKNNGEPDFSLLEKLVDAVNIPVILEGRVWTLEHVKKAFKIGAYAIVIGSAITKPKLITERFVNCVKEF
jgi:N-acylglucosamine-6-phosphate 2-epimerase